MIGFQNLRFKIQSIDLQIKFIFMISQQFIDKIWIFSPLDKLLTEYKDNKNTFIAAYGRKEILLNLIKEYKIDSKKYKKIVTTSRKDQNEMIRTCAIEDISKIKDSKDENMLQEWFRQMIENTGADYEKQTQQHKKYMQVNQPKGENFPSKMTGVSLQEVQKSLLKVTQSKFQSKLKVEQKPQIDYREIVSFKAADRLLDQHEGNFEVYENIFDRKAKLLSLIEKKEISADKYKKYLQSYLQKIKNEDILLDTKFEYEALNDFHDGDVQQWFKEIYEETKQSIEEQKRKLAKLKYSTGLKKTGNSLKLTINNHVSEIRKTEIVAPKYSVIKNSGLHIKVIYCFEALNDLIINNKDNQQFQNMLEERKKSLMNEYQSGVLTAEKYKSLIQSNAKMQDVSQAVKDSIRFQLSLIPDFHQGNIQEWFKEIIAKNLIDPGEEFSQEVQEKRKQVNIPVKEELQASEAKFGVPSGSQISKQKSISRVQRIQVSRVNELKASKVQNSRVHIEVSNASSVDLAETGDKQIRKISNLKVIDVLLNQYQSNGNTEMYTCLFERKEHLLSEFKNKTINGEGYKRMQQEEVKKLETHVSKPAFKETIIIDLSKLKMNYNNNVNQWLDAIINESEQSYEGQKIHYQKIKAQKNSQNEKKDILGIVTQSLKIKKKLDTTIRMQTFLKSMAIYQSFLYYHKKNKIPYSTHKYLIEYQKTKKSAYDYIEKIEQDKSLDVLNLVDALFPPLNVHIFYAGEFEIYKTKIETLILDLKKQIQALNEYASKIKKTNNVQNLSTVKTQIAACEQSIKKLKEWPKGIYHAFPEVKYEKIKKINTDLNKIASNQIEVVVNHIQGLGSEHVLNVYFFSFSQTKHSFTVNDGPISNIRIIQKLNQDQITTVFKGSQKYITFKLYQKGFFGGLTLIGEQHIEPSFYRVNTIDERVQIGSTVINYVVKVQRPKTPMETVIQHVQVIMFPQYEHSAFIEQQVIKKFMPYCNPSPSQIVG